jgi:hypothetical protein
LLASIKFDKDLKDLIGGCQQFVRIRQIV